MNELHRTASEVNKAFFLFVSMLSTLFLLFLFMPDLCLLCCCCYFSPYFLCPATLCIPMFDGAGLLPLWEMMLPTRLTPQPWAWSLGLPIKNFSRVSCRWRHSDLTSCICDLWALLGPHPLWGEGGLSACFCQPGALRPASRHTLHLCVYLPVAKPQAAICLLSSCFVSRLLPVCVITH